jgi:phosphopantothenoylcysteine decarboxylase / phosphopantothenate---cysteine ligase
MAPTPSSPLDGARVVLGVSGGIAAYKAAIVLRLLASRGAEVQVVRTRSVAQFVGDATWEALSGRPVLTDTFEQVDSVAHVRLGREADAVVVVPATADLMARAATGRADDMLAATLLTTRAPVAMFPAMHTEMWLHPATVANVATLRSRGVFVSDPAVGRLTGPDSGPGRLPEPDAILPLVEALLSAPVPGRRDLAGRRVVVSAGGTREQLDPVRYLGNISSGRQGWALAAAALVRGASVRLVAAPTELEQLPGLDQVDVVTTAELAAAVREGAAEADAVVMAAAVADFTAAEVATTKVKKTEEPAGDRERPFAFRRTEDVLAGLVAERGERRAADPAAGPTVIVGFAAETGDTETSAAEHARAKARRKGADLLVFNDVSGGAVFGAPHNDVTLLDAAGEVVGCSSGSKAEVAHAIWDAVAQRTAPSAV